MLMNYNYSLIPNLRDPVFKLRGLIDEQLKDSLTSLLASADIPSFSKSDIGAKYSLKNDSGLGKELFNTTPVQRLAKVVTSASFVSLLSDLFRKSTSTYLSHPLLEDSPSVLPSCLNTFIPKEYSNVPISRSWYSSQTSSSLDSITNFILAYNSIPFIPSMQFSLINKGGFIPPHTDTTQKLASILLYLPLNSKQKSSPLGTTFWRNKGNRFLAQEESNFVNERNMPTFLNFYDRIRTTFSDDETIIFFRSDTTWHSFEYDIDDIGPRYSININYNTP